MSKDTVEAATAAYLSGSAAAPADGVGASSRQRKGRRRRQRQRHRRRYGGLVFFAAEMSLRLIFFAFCLFAVTRAHRNFLLHFRELLAPYYFDPEITSQHLQQQLQQRPHYLGHYQQQQRQQEAAKAQRLTSSVVEEIKKEEEDEATTSRLRRLRSPKGKRGKRN